MTIRLWLATAMRAAWRLGVGASLGGGAQVAATHYERAAALHPAPVSGPPAGNDKHEPRIQESRACRSVARPGGAAPLGRSHVTCEQ